MHMVVQYTLSTVIMTHAHVQGLIEVHSHDLYYTVQVYI